MMLALCAALQCEPVASLDGSDARRRNHVRIRRCVETVA